MQEPSRGLDTANSGESPVQPLASVMGLSSSIDSPRLAFQPASRTVLSKGKATPYDNFTNGRIVKKTENAIGSVALAENGSARGGMTPTGASPPAGHNSHDTETSWDDSHDDHDSDADDADDGHDDKESSDHEDHDSGGDSDDGKDSNDNN